MKVREVAFITKATPLQTLYNPILKDNPNSTLDSGLV